jgi:predicted HTH domain antitoxin
MGDESAGETNTITIEYPQELLWALQQEPEEFAAQAQILLAIKLYETGKLSTGLAARVAGVPRSTFFYLLGQHGLSPFAQSSDELEDDLTHARAARHHQ